MMRDLQYKRYNRLVEYVSRVNVLKTHIDNDLWKIVTDQIYAYFDGERTVVETAELIQNRASIMVSERF